MTRALALLLLLACAGPAFAQPAASSEARSTMQTFAILYRPGPAWREGEPMHRQALGPHARYVAQLNARGQVYAGGPLGERRGLAVIAAPSLEEARRILAEDPAITAGVFEGEVLPFDPRFGGEQPIPVRRN